MNEAGVLRYFARYNAMVWPMQLVVYLLCFIALFLAVKKYKYSDRTIAVILAFFWAWNGIVFFPPTGAAFAPYYAVAALFVIQGILFLIGVAKPFVSYRIGTDIYSLTGIVLILYGLIGSPLVGVLVGHLYPQMALVGLFPCPLLAFTFGMLLCADSKVPKYLLVIPLLWGLSGVMGMAMGMWEDLGMLLSALLATAMIVYRDRMVMIGHAPRPA
ncbi:hypothetical protein ANRL1_01981 [Anaerolineae bacterium]|nr:hypothetical protein ANRL1_01981 [Anaerolineae bacterium]